MRVVSKRPTRQIPEGVGRIRVHIRSGCSLCPVDVYGFDGIEVEAESVAVLVESLAFGVVHRGVTFEDGNHPGMIVVGPATGSVSPTNSSR